LAVYCSKCGANLADNATFCSQCGQPVSLAPTYAPPGAPGAMAGNAAVVASGGYAAAPVVAGYPQTPSYAYTVVYAGFWLRVLAYFIDAAILGIFAVPILIGAGMATGIGGAIANLPHNDGPFVNGMPPIFALFIAGCIFLGVFGTWLYFAYLESSEWQGTAGKKVLGLIVTDMQGQRVTFARASGRHFAKLVTSFIPLGIGYAMAGFTEKRQALHDMIASCLVLRKN
jgi:uncharacterized RDD family membrane protein YckC